MPRGPPSRPHWLGSPTAWAWLQPPRPCASALQLSPLGTGCTWRLRRGPAPKQRRRPTLKLLEGREANRLSAWEQRSAGPSAPAEEQVPSAGLTQLWMNCLHRPDGSMEKSKNFCGSRSGETRRSCRRISTYPRTTLPLRRPSLENIPTMVS